MIGHYLLTLSAEQEDRVLTHVMRPGPYCGGCLIGTIYGVHSEGSEGLPKDFHDPLLPGGYSRIGRRWNGARIGTRYDYLCNRFGAPRVNAAIRNRLLSNRARRVLAPVSRETAVSVQV